MGGTPVRVEVVLQLLDRATWRAAPVPGERSHALLAALALGHGRVVPDARLVAEVWADDEPANPTKALQVLVSRVRSQTDASIIERSGDGYRLALPAGAVDVLALGTIVRDATAAERAGDAVAAAAHARSALAVGVPEGAATGPVAELREAATADLLRAAEILGRAASALGEHDEALALLAGLTEPDETTLAALLRSEAAVHGAPEALRRYERHRAEVRDRLGVDPGPVLQAVHADLLAADSPVREGVRFETSPLVGRDADLRALRAIVRESRVTSILGPGGLGKTRLAHLLGREAEQQVVHFVELVGVTSPEDVVGEVGSALGVRDSVSGRRLLTPEQRNDVRSQVAQHLDQGPTLLILDNCEHVVAAVADLVAFLVATTDRLRVVTTTRAPLAIAAERVFPLAQLSAADAADLFAQRARAARPDVRLEPEAVRRVVARLDGLPLAIELAAARVRAMSVDDIDSRLDDRFALLRGRDRSLPDRHQTLLAVIDWSWALLAEPERRALRRLAVFHDGFTLEAASSVLGADALDVVEGLVDQSLLAVRDVEGRTRYRMLETIREFGRIRLAEAGEAEDARLRLLAWATDFAAARLGGLHSAQQVETMDAVRAEENNLADILREALALGDRATTVTLLATVGGFWTVRGEHTRLVALCTAVEDVLRGWDPSDDLVEATVATAALLVLNTAVGLSAGADGCREVLARHGHRTRDPRVTALVLVLTADDPLDPVATARRLDALAADPDRHVAALALQFSCHGRENAGDLAGAIGAGLRALELWRADDGAFAKALLHTQLAGLYAQLGFWEPACEQSLAAIPLLDRIDAHDDALGVRSVLACAAILTGRHDEAARWIAEVRSIGPSQGALSGSLFEIAAAELDLAEGRTAAGLLAYRAAVEELRQTWFPGLGPLTGLEAWTVFGEGSALMAHALHASGAEGVDLHRTVRAKAGPCLAQEGRDLDFPVAGMLLFAVGGWGLHRGDLPVPDAVRLLVLAERFSYNRFAPSLAWERTAGLAERLAPGLLGRLQEEYGDRRGPDLLDEARAVVAALPAGPGES